MKKWMLIWILLVFSVLLSVNSYAQDDSLISQHVLFSAKKSIGMLQEKMPKAILVKFNEAEANLKLLQDSISKARQSFPTLSDYQSLRPMLSLEMEDDPYGIAQWYRVEFDKETSEEAVDSIIVELLNSESVSFAEVDSPYALNFGTRVLAKRGNVTDSAKSPFPFLKSKLPAIFPNDEYFDKQWGLHNTGQEGGTVDADIDAPEAWAITQGSSDMVIAVIDTGIDDMHPDLVNQMWHDKNGSTGYDFFNMDPEPLDEVGHGTHVAGIVAAETNNSIGVAGTCPNCRVMNVQACGMYMGMSGCTLEAIINGIIYAVKNDARIISMSFNGSKKKVFEDTLLWAEKKGVALIAAAGNDDIDLNGLGFPAAYPNVIGVAASNRNDHRAHFSNYGPWVDVAAPGKAIFSTMPTYKVPLNSMGFKQNYDYMDGTSMATPMVAGMIALLRSNPVLVSESNFRGRLVASAEQLVEEAPPLYYKLPTRTNIYKAHLINPRTHVRIDDLEISDISRSEAINAGEEVNIELRLRNFWEKAQSVKTRLSRDDIGVNIVIDFADYGALEALGSKTRSFKLQTEVDFVGEMLLRYTSKVDDELVKHYSSHMVEYAIMSGFPIEQLGINYTFDNLPRHLSANFDNRIGKEIALSLPDKNNSIYVYDHRGNKFSGWPKKLGDSENCRIVDILAGDIDGRGYDSLVAAELCKIPDEYYSVLSVYAWDVITGQLFNGWPINRKVLSNKAEAFIALGDLDGNGDYEVVVAEHECKLGYPYGYECIFAYNSDGQVIAGNWPIYIPTDLYSKPSSLMVGDLNGDRKAEIAQVTNASVYLISEGRVKWEKIICHNQSRTEGEGAIANLDDDADLEIVASCVDWDSSGSFLTHLVAYDFDGSVVSPWDIHGYFGSNSTVLNLQVADFDHDSKNEVYLQRVLNTNYIFDDDGSVLSKPGSGGIDLSYYSIADITATSGQELLRSLTYEFSPMDFRTGFLIDEWKLHYEHYDSPCYNPLQWTSISDIDEDGDLEVLGLISRDLMSNDEMHYRLYAWDLDYLYDKTALDWPHRGQNPKRNRCLDK